MIAVEETCFEGSEDTDRGVHFEWRPDRIGREQVRKAVGVVREAERCGLIGRSSQLFETGPQDANVCGVGSFEAETEPPQRLPMRFDQIDKGNRAVSGAQ